MNIEKLNIEIIIVEYIAGEEELLDTFIKKENYKIIKSGPKSTKTRICVLERIVEKPIISGVSEVEHITNISLVEEKEFKIYTDGSSLGNPGAGGWAYIISENLGTRVGEDSGSEKYTTNQRMELEAAIKACEGAFEMIGSHVAMSKVRCNFILYSDSKYVVDGINSWIHGWLKNGWKNSNKKAIANIDLWKRLLVASDPLEIKFEWVKGHSSHPENDAVDKMAVAASKGQI